MTAHKYYKGTIIENSLADKKVLKELDIISTRQVGNWVLHEVQVPLE